MMHCNTTIRYYFACVPIKGFVWQSRYAKVHKNAKLDTTSRLCFYLSYRHIKSCCIADYVFPADASSFTASSFSAYIHNLSFPLWLHIKRDQISLQTSTRNKQQDWRSSIFTHLSILRNDVKGWFMSSIFVCLLYLL